PRLAQRALAGGGPLERAAADHQRRAGPEPAAHQREPRRRDAAALRARAHPAGRDSATEPDEGHMALSVSSTHSPAGAPARLTRLVARSRRRQRERGAAVFLVVMVLTIVAAIGVFSMR